MRKRIILLLAVAEALILFTSCSSKELAKSKEELVEKDASVITVEKTIDSKQDSTLIQENKQPYQIPLSYSKKGDIISFNTEIIMSPKVLEDGLYYMTATLQQEDYDKAYEVLFKDKESVEKEEFEEIDGKGVFYQNPNYESLSISPSILLYMTKESSYYAHSFSEYDDDYNANLYSTVKEFDFATKEESWNKIKGIFESIELELGDDYTCYSLDYETLEKEEYAMGSDGKEDTSIYKEKWTEEDNGYFFIAHQVLQNCTVQYPIQGVFEKVSEQNAPIKILFTKDGFKLIDIEGLFDFKISDNYINLLPFEEIANHVKDKYEMLLTESTYDVTKAELYLRPILNGEGSYDVIPTWQFTIIDKGNNSEAQMYINAITGDEIV